MIAAKIFELKNRLSAYLREVKNGHEILIMERETPVAKMVPYSNRMRDFTVREPRGDLQGIKKIPRVKLRKRVDILKILEETRGDRWE